ncbi:threonine transporter [Saccharomonospora viridis]|uniref:Threonine transporter n=1 Tax=Saccharomonospora viridis TaxID=1852 RepID=A0A837D900_9PSEU|nr:threonine transporter [Saccharomonospora viridis]
MPSLAGHHVATLVVTAAIGFGTGVAVLRHPLFAKALSVVGSFYVL